MSELEYASESGEITRFVTVIITYGEGRPIDSSPNFPDIENAITWSRERTSHVIAKYLDSTYFWAGIGEPPSDVSIIPEFLGTRERDESNAQGIVTLNESTWLIMSREIKGISVAELAELSSVSQKTIESIEVGKFSTKIDLSIWLRIVSALTERELPQSGERLVVPGGGNLQVAIGVIMHTLWKRSA